MTIFDRISNLTNPAQQSAHAPASELDVVERRLSQLHDEIAQAHADVRAIGLRRQATDATVTKLTEQASAGALDDPARLTAALRQQRELAADNSASLRLQSLQAEQETLQREIHAHRRTAATEAYHEAVQRYACACSPLPALAEQIKGTAVAAGVMLSASNSPHLIGREIQIGGALVDVTDAQ
jgi:TPR repeat protein